LVLNGDTEEVRDWLESTELLCGIDKIISMFKPRRKIFCKCNLKCLVLYNNGKAIPVTRIFDTKTINRKIIKLYEKNSRACLWSFLIYFFANQVVLNFFKNHNFRLLLLKMLKIIPHLVRGDRVLFSPFNFITLAIFPTVTNLDFDFVDECNFSAISADDFGFEPGCIHRIKALRKDELAKVNK
jgi:hypothetical protein